MAELPIVVQTTEWLWMLFGVVMFGISLYVAVMARRVDDVVDRLKIAAIALVLFLIGVALLVRDVGWELRLDRKSIAMHAPFDLFLPSAEIAWSDVTSVDFIDIGARGPAPFLRVRGRGDTQIRVANPNALPQQFYVALRQTLAQRSPQVDFKELVG